MIEALRRIPAEELRDVATIGKQANTGVQKHGGRRTIRGKIAVSEKEGDCLGYIEPAILLQQGSCLGTVVGQGCGQEHGGATDATYTPTASWHAAGHVMARGRKKGCWTVVEA